jgi:hypothetical protein
MNICVVSAKGNQLRGLKSVQSTLFRHIPALMQGKARNFTIPKTLTGSGKSRSSDADRHCIFANKPKIWS